MANTVATRAFSDEELRSLQTYNDLRALVNEKKIPVVNASDVLSDGFELTKDKAGLVGIEFVIVDWRFTASSEYEDGEFVTVRLITAQNAKLIINDGSKGGIRDQLKSVAPEGVLFVKNGLRVSEYEYTDEKGKKNKARSYYLSA